MNGRRNFLLEEDRSVHGWYRFVLSFPAHLVRTYLDRFEIDGTKRVLDPFCGTGTTMVECKKHSIPSVGIEANPMAYYASHVKTDWTPDPDGLLQHAQEVADCVYERLSKDGIQDDAFFRIPLKRTSLLRSLSPEQLALLLKDSISPLPLHKVLVLLQAIEESRNVEFFDHERIALAKVMVENASNLHFGPEVGVGKKKLDAPVVDPWLKGIQSMADDLREVGDLATVPVTVHSADARQVKGLIKPASIDAVITSPPYPNEKDYTRTTRLESVVLGLVRTKMDLRTLKKDMVRSNTRGVYVDDDDDKWASRFPEVQRIAEEIEARRIELGKTSGFERLYPRLTRLYFGGMARHLAALRPVLRPGAQLAYVVGDQASYLRVLIRTGKILGDIAQSLGYEVVGNDLFRTRLSTTTRKQMREEVLLLRWHGKAWRQRARVGTAEIQDSTLASRDVMMV
jgi:DNA modification methylase